MATSRLVAAVRIALARNPWTRPVALTLAALAALPASSARAETVDATATTLLSARRETRDGKLYLVAPGFELVTLRGSDLQAPGLQNAELVLSFWGSATAGDPRDDRTFTGDVNVGYLRARTLSGRLELQAGRQFVMNGVAQGVQIDGLSATMRLWRGLGISAYGGVPVLPRFGARNPNDLLGGSRVFFSPSADSEVGVSFLYAEDDGKLAREDVGVDLWQALPMNFTVGGFALWTLAEERLAEGDAAVTWRPCSGFQLRGDYMRTAPDLFLPRNSILSVFGGDTRDEGGGSATVRLLPRLRLQGEYHHVWVSGSGGGGHRAAARLFGSAGVQSQSVFGVETRLLDLPDAGYLQGRLFGSHRVTTRLTLTGDADAYHFTQAINGEKASYLFTATAGYALNDSWRVLASGSGGVTPFLERRLDAMVRLSYNATMHVREVKP